MFIGNKNLLLLLYYCNNTIFFTSKCKFHTKIMLNSTSKNEVSKKVQITQMTQIHTLKMKNRKKNQ